MARLALILKIGAALAVTCAMAGCDQPKWRGGAAQTEQKAADHQSSDAAPAMPAWAGELIGKPLRSVFTGDGQCVGNTDMLEMRYVGAQPGAKIIGWGWDPAARQPVQRIILVNADYLIVGAGESGLERGDVPAARPEITSKTTGWAAIANAPKGAVDVYGVLGDGKSICKLGHLDY
jgi:hypothetical protein